MGRPKKLTKEVVLDAINGWLREHGIPPSIEELRLRLGVGSKRTVLRYLDWLEESGDIERVRGMARGLRSLGTGARRAATRSVPVVGVVPAGPLMLAEQNIEGWVRVPEKMAPQGARFFLLRVQGDSMNRARVSGQRIEDGDLALVRQQATAEDGEIVVALVDDEATIKLLARGPGFYTLKPDSTNRAHQPIVLERDFRIQGVIVGVFKKGAGIID